MTPFEQFIQNLSVGSFNFWFLIKILFVIGFGLYIAFAAIVIRQVKVMSEVVEGLSVWPLKIFAWAHLAFAVFVFLLSLTIL
ncbi:MAG: hypothetical protein NTV20_01735 [Candidatus Shapirobacteria bacterium]|nr:hypothetical protein [Candidatus Shapirobacteria bacterium]